MRPLHSLTGAGRHLATHRGRAGPLRSALSLLVVATLATMTACTTTSGTSGDAAGSGRRGGWGHRHPRPRARRARGRTPQSVVQKTPKPLQSDRLAQGLVPPTNRWFSSLALGPEALPVFAVPLSFTEQDDRVRLRSPEVTTSDKAIMGGAVSDVTVTVPGVGRPWCPRYDDLTVTLEQRASDGKALGHTVLAQGSPTVTFTATDAVDLGQNVAFTAGRAANRHRRRPHLRAAARQGHGQRHRRSPSRPAEASPGSRSPTAVRHGHGLGRRPGHLRTGRVRGRLRLGDHHPQLLARGRWRRRARGHAPPEGRSRGRDDLRPRDLSERLRHPVGLSRRHAHVERADP